MPALRLSRDPFRVARRRAAAQLPRRRPCLDLVQRAHDPASAPVEDVGVDHRRLHVLVSQQFLDRPDVVAVLEEVVGRRQV